MPDKKLFASATTFLIVVAAAFASHLAIAQEDPPARPRGTRVENATMEFSKIEGRRPEFTIYRAQIPGGWLVTQGLRSDERSSMTFVPDPNHEWDGNSVGHTRRR